MIDDPVNITFNQFTYCEFDNYVAPVLIGVWWLQPGQGLLNSWDNWRTGKAISECTYDIHTPFAIPKPLITYIQYIGTSQ